MLIFHLVSLVEIGSQKKYKIWIIEILKYAQKSKLKLKSFKNNKYDANTLVDDFASVRASQKPPFKLFPLL